MGPFSRGSPRHPARRARALRVSLLAGMLAALCYVTALPNPFVYDDFRLVLHNPSLLDPLRLHVIAATEATRPLVNFSFAIDQAVWGLRPIGFRGTNIALHVVNVLLLFQLTWRMMDDRERVASRSVPGESLVVAAVTSAVFAVHPMMTQAVGYISGRAEVLCATFFLSAFLLLRRWMLEGGRVRLIGGVTLWTASLMCKEVGAMLPFVLLAYERLLIRDDPGWRRRLWRFHAPLIAFTVLAGVARLAVLLGIENPGEGQVYWSHALVELDVARRYVSMLIYPVGQSVFHETPRLESVADPRVVLMLLWFSALLIIGWRVHLREPVVTFGLTWFALLLVPSAVLVMVNLGEPMAEHRVYLASCGFFAATGVAVDRVYEALQGRRFLRVVPVALFASWIIVLGTATQVRHKIWSSRVLLWADAVRKAPNVWVPHLQFGDVLEQAGMQDLALAEYREAVRLRPDQELPRLKLGLLLAELGRLEEAKTTFLELLALRPGAVLTLNALGAVAMIEGRTDLAGEYYLRALRANPSNVTVWESVALMIQRLDDSPADALVFCEQVQAVTSDVPGIAECIERHRASS